MHVPAYTANFLSDRYISRRGFNFALWGYRLMGVLTMGYLHDILKLSPENGRVGIVLYVIPAGQETGPEGGEKG